MNLAETRPATRKRDISRSEAALLEERTGRPKIRDAVKFSQSNFLEVYFWLHLGVELGYFPVRESQELLDELSAEMRLSEDIWPQVRHFFPGALHIVRSNAIRESYFSITDYGCFLSPESVHTAFQLVLSIEGTFARNPVAQIFTTALVFCADNMWNELTNRKVRPVRLKRALRSQTQDADGPAMETMLAGTLFSLEHMAILQDFLENLYKTELDAHDVVLFNRRVKEICFWRLSLINENLRKRYLGLAESVTRVIWGEIVTEGSTLEHEAYARAFLNCVEGIIDGWNRGVTMALTEITPSPRAEAAKV